MMIRCYECGREISSLASACPHCGAPAVIDMESLHQGGSIGYRLSRLFHHHKRTFWLAFLLLIFTILLSGIIVKIFTGVLAVLLILLYLGYSRPRGKGPSTDRQ